MSCQEPGSDDDGSRPRPTSGARAGDNPPARRSGRRRGDSGTRDAIEVAARRQFAALGFDRTSLRGIATEAGVDPTLVTHFYGSKPKLFLTVVELPFDPSVVLPSVLRGDRDGLGLRLARFLVSLLESSDSRQRVIGIIRAAASEPEAARLARDVVTRELIGSLVDHLAVDDAPLRVALIGSQMVGLVMARHIVGLEPLVSASPETLVATLAPTLQRLLVEPLDPTP